MDEAYWILIGQVAKLVLSCAVLQALIFGLAFGAAYLLSALL